MFKKMLLAIGLLTIPFTATAADITGAGATFPYPIYAKWADSYKKLSGVTLNYQSIGSGGGIKQIAAKTVTFGATDKPLNEKELAKDGLIQWPMVIGGIVPIIRLEGIESGQMVLDGETLANIYLGKINKWDDAAIKALNPKLNLPNKAIIVIRRSDGSGTTFNFTNYLSKISADWKSKVGEGTAVEFPVGIGAKGNEGVANNVMQTDGSIGYVEYAYAKQNDITYTNMINAAGKNVRPTAKSFAAAAEKADWNGTPGFAVIISNQPGDNSWPMSAATFILMHAEPSDKANSKQALAFFNYAFDQGDSQALALDYIPMPESVKAKIKKDAMGKINVK